MEGNWAPILHRSCLVFQVDPYLILHDVVEVSQDLVRFHFHVVVFRQLLVVEVECLLNRSDDWILHVFDCLLDEVFV